MRPVEPPPRAPRPKLLFVFGEDPDGYVDVADIDGDVAVHVTRADADRMITKRDEEIDRVWADAQSGN